MNPEIKMIMIDENTDGVIENIKHIKNNAETINGNLGDKQVFWI
ncbi:MAG: hypothetical protein SVM80_00635 [Halobacteriota archaeon]|nr:hypothetical protein [Halobacteriota archaeon]